MIPGHRSHKLLSIVQDVLLIVNTWVISKLLHTVTFLFKNEFVLQNTFTIYRPSM